MRTVCELVQAAVQKQDPRRQAKHRGLSQVYYICQQRSFFTTGQGSHSFPMNAASSGMCGCVRRILSHELTHCPPGYLQLEGRWWGLVLLTSYPHEPTDPLSVSMRLIITADRPRLPLHPIRQRTERSVSLTLSKGENMFRVLTEALGDT